MFILGLQGMPRRYYDYLPEFTFMNQLSTVGSWILAIGFIVIIWNLVKGARKGAIADKNPWGGATLEWTTASPPTIYNFPEPPVVTHGPYEYSQEND